MTHNKINLTIALSLISTSTIHTQAMDEGTDPFKGSEYGRILPEIRGVIHEYEKIIDKKFNMDDDLQEFTHLLDSGALQGTNLEIFIEITSERGLENLKMISSKNPQAFDQIKNLRLYKRTFSPLKGLVEFICGDSGFKNLNILDLSGNHIGNAGAQTIAQSPNLSQLTSLNLAFNDIGYDGIEAIAQSAHLSNLMSLNLTNNDINEYAAEAIAQSPYLSNLTSLNLERTNVGEDGALEIQKAFPNLIDFKI